MYTYIFIHTHTLTLTDTYTHTHIYTSESKRRKKMGINEIFNLLGESKRTTLEAADLQKYLFKYN